MPTGEKVFNRREWSTVSKAKDRSKRRKTEYSFFGFDVSRSVLTLESTVHDDSEDVFITISSGQNSDIIISSNYDIIDCIVEEDDSILPFSDTDIVDVAEDPTGRVNLHDSSTVFDKELDELLGEMNRMYSSATPSLVSFTSNPLKSENLKYIVFQDTEDENRIGHYDWCQCQNCIPMPTNIESVCCKEISNADAFLEELNCITEHELFVIYCKRVETVNINFRSWGIVQQEPSVKDLNRLLRKTAYRSFTAWIHGYLGPCNRRPIPACAVNSVRISFPDPESIYLGYKNTRERAAEFLAFE
ncbi:uncharacterized protein LOC122935140 [Bufo gargarizans]|uniref:uncharacterized protein LOC122935140 n=1 Tax=Bufo gargarizans TaxID=30331 RepID=UPI001CF565A9|nr:uncharacterized protein LOC122935140 [Bufo gargarizans]